MEKQTFSSVWDAIEDDPLIAEEMKRRSKALMTLKDSIRKNGWDQATAAEKLGTSPDKIVGIMKGKINQFDIEELMRLERRIEQNN